MLFLTNLPIVLRPLKPMLQFPNESILILYNLLHLPLILLYLIHFLQLTQNLIIQLFILL